MSQKISDMTAATDLSGAVIPIVQGGANKKAAESLIFPTQIAKGVTVNRRHGNQDFSSTLGTLALTINSLRASPIRISEYTTIDKITFEITIGASGNMWAAIYDCDANAMPNNLLVWSTAFAIAAPGVKESLSVASYTLKPGIYWIAYLTDTANTARSIPSATNLPYFLGLPSTMNSLYGTAVAVGLAYQATPPNPFTGGAVISNAGFNMPFLGYRAI